MQKTLDSLIEFDLNLLPDDWVQKVFDGEFIESFELPDEYGSYLEVIKIKSALQGVINHLDKWMMFENEEKSWTSLSQCLSYNKILALIFHLVDSGVKNVHIEEERSTAIVSARLYFKLLSIPGYNAFNIYHSQLFMCCVNCLKFLKELLNQDGYYSTTHEFIQEVNRLSRNLKEFLNDLLDILKPINLKIHDETFEEVMGCLVDITSVATIHKKLNLDQVETIEISEVAYKCIDLLTSKKEDGNNTTSINILFKCLLPKMTNTTMDSKVCTALMRASFVNYAGKILSRYGNTALPGYMIMIQHLCYNLDGLERSEVRCARAALAVSLVTMVPAYYFESFNKWILILSKTAKAPHRHLAMEIIGKLISGDVDVAEYTNHMAQCSSEIQAAAMNSSDATSLAENQIRIMGHSDDQIFMESLTNPDNRSQSGEDLLAINASVKHVIPYQEFLTAVYDRVFDVSSTVRMKALSLISQTVQCKRAPLQRAITVQNGNDSCPTLVVVAMKCTADERAAVRKAAVSLVDSLAKSDRTQVTKNNLKVIVGLCRDASIMVRTTAIKSLSELMMMWPDDCTIGAFLAGPLHQLSDPESKVQDIIVDAVKRVLIDELKPYDALHNRESTVPWLFLSAVTKFNMRQHLQKACGLIHKMTKCINFQIVDVIRTHVDLNATHDLSSWVFLSCVARYVDHGDINFVINHYYEVTHDPQRSDPRSIPLILEVIQEWSHELSPAEAGVLRARLLRRLHEGCSHARTLAVLAAHLQPHDLAWADQMLLACERRAVEGAPVEEWLAAADVALVAPSPPGPVLLHTMLRLISTFHYDQHELSVNVRARCVAALGRLCVRSRASAAAAAPALARLLAVRSAHSALRVNALLAIADIATRYTCITEPLLGYICECLHVSTASEVRLAAVRSLTRLLLGGFLRLRAPLQHRYLALLADPEQEVREPVQYYLTTALPAEALYHHFVECILYYNNCPALTENDDDEARDAIFQEAGGLSGLEGEQWFDSRQLVYDMMVQRMSVMQRAQTQVRVARELVGAAVRAGRNALRPAAHAALRDAVAVLRSAHMRPPRKAHAGDPTDFENMAARITTNIVSQKMKLTVAEVVVPSVMALYQQEVGTPLADDLLQLACHLLNDYKQEIEEFLDDDPDLKAQIAEIQQRSGTETFVSNKLNIVLTEIPEVENTPCMRRHMKRRMANHRSTPSKRSLRLNSQF